MFENRRKTVVEEPRVAAPAEDPALRDEKDPDPLIEEMVERLRDGLSSMNAFDEWGRPIAWRNVVRLAVGPLMGRLRDAETAVAVATHLSPPEPAAVLSEAVTEAVQEAVHDAVHQAVHEVMEPEAGAVRYGVAAVASRPLEDVAVDDAVLEPSGSEAASDTLGSPDDGGLAIAPVASQTEPWVAPEAQLGSYDEAPAEPAAAPVPEAEQPAQPEDVAGHVHLHVAPVTAVPNVTSIFPASGDEGAVPMGSLGAGELLRRRSTDNPTVAKYDRFLTSLYGERQQMRGDEDRRSR